MKHMKNLVLAAALVAAPVLWAPQAAAVSTYACVKNKSFVLIKSRISYRTVRSDGSIQWKRSPWSDAVPAGWTACVDLSRAPVGQNFYVEAKEAAWWFSKPQACKRRGHTGAVKRTSKNRRDKPYYVSFDFSLGGRCNSGPHFINECNTCSYKSW